MSASRANFHQWADGWMGGRKRTQAAAAALAAANSAAALVSYASIMATVLKLNRSLAGHHFYLWIPAPGFSWAKLSLASRGGLRTIGYIIQSATEGCARAGQDRAEWSWVESSGAKRGRVNRVGLRLPRFTRLLGQTDAIMAAGAPPRHYSWKLRP